ncbi:hypothetical protein ACXR2T_10770 [Leucobacter sp. HY1910]
MKQYAKLTSVDKYVSAKIRPRTFYGNEVTASGHRWEPMILAYLGIPGNTAFVHAPDNPRYGCTPDGIQDEGRFILAECKARHGVIKPNPDAGEWRQLSWQLMCFPEAELVRFGTVTLLRDEHDQWEAREGGYSVLDVPRDHPKIIAATEQIMPIAAQVLAALDAAQHAMKEAPF